MRSFTHTLLAGLCFLSLPSWSKGQTQSFELFVDSNYTEIEEHYRTSDGSMVVAGTSNFRKYIAAFDPSHTLTWAHAVGAEQMEVNDVILDENGNAYLLLVSWETYPWFTDSTLYLLAKFDDAGNMAWVKEFHVDEQYHFRGRLALDPLGELLVTLGVDYHLVTLKLTTTGDVVWSKDIFTPEPGSAGARDILSDNDEGVYIVGAGGEQMFLIKLLHHGEGQIAWAKHLHYDETSTSPNPWALALLPGGGVLIGGSLGGLDVEAGFIYAYTADGEVLWQKHYKQGLNTIYIRELFVRNDRIYAYGLVYYPEDIFYKPLIMELDMNGELTGPAVFLTEEYLYFDWHTYPSFGSASDPGWSYAFHAGADGYNLPFTRGRIIFSEEFDELGCELDTLHVTAVPFSLDGTEDLTADPGPVALPSSLALYPVDPLLQLFCFTTSVAQSSEVATPLVYPDPFVDELRLNTVDHNGSIAVHAADGRLVYSDRTLPDRINTSSWPDGLYLVRIMRGDQVSTHKLVK